MKFILLFGVFALVACFSGLCGSARAETPVSVILYKADPLTPTGYREEYHWRMNRTDEWRRFEYLATTKMRSGKKEDISPFLLKTDEILALSIKDDNGITGRDYYLSKKGITLTSIGAKNVYYDDSNGFFSFLKSELTQRKGFEQFPGEKISIDSPGIVVRYNINENLANPAWLIDTQKDINLYDAFLRGMPQASNGDVQSIISDQSMENKGNFVLILNYPKAPAKFVTAGGSGVRLSTVYSSDVFLMDDKNYYKFFYDLTKESLRTTTEIQVKEKKIQERGQF